jgi:hypothetical protein
MTQAGAKGPAVPAKPAAVSPAKGVSPHAPAVTPKAPAAAHPAPAHPAAGHPAPAHPAPAATPKAAAPLAPKVPKGPPPLPPESGPDVGARAAEPMRARLETSPGMGGASGIGGAAETPRSPPAQSREEIQELVRAAVANGVAAVLAETQRIVHGLERRIDELERRPAAAVAPPPPAMAPHPRPGATAPFTAAAPASAIPVHYAPPSRAPVLDLATIERDVHIDVDSALDGGRRKRRLVVVVVLFILVIFGGLFAMLAQSYSHHG